MEKIANFQKTLVFQFDTLLDGIHGFRLPLLHCSIVLNPSVPITEIEIRAETDRNNFNMPLAIASNEARVL